MTILALTMGEPAGIGGEITLSAWQSLRPTGPAFVLLDDPDRVRAVAAAIGADVRIEAVDRARHAADVFARALPVLPLNHTVSFGPGKPARENAPAVIEAIDTAVRLAQTGEVGAIVTNPIHKFALQEAGFAHPGHTEYLAALARVPRTVMMLAGPDLRVVPVTIHIPLKDVPSALTAQALADTARITDAALRRDFAIPEPRIAVAGLNPHAGEFGRMGQEESTLIAPTIRRLRAEGLTIFGPLSPDTLFHARARAAYDVALCMYHDQALIPLKTLAFDEGVNVTLGLPFVRTSPDHGTALDIAGQGIARPASLIAALRLAGDLARTPRASSVLEPTQ